MKASVLGLSLLLVCLTATSAFSQNDLYDNGPINGFNTAWSISFGFTVSDQFTLGTDSTVNGIQFGAWLDPGDTIESAEVSITSSEFGGTSFVDETVSFTASDCFSNGIVNVCTETGSLTPTALAAGSYWLNLSNASTVDGNPVVWDENSGPSLASESDLGTVPSESFTILGNSNVSTTPEPSSIMLLGSGIVGLAGMLRRNWS